MTIRRREFVTLAGAAAFALLMPMNLLVGPIHVSRADTESWRRPQRLWLLAPFNDQPRQIVL